MCAIATNALYTAMGRRGTTRQLARVIVVCVISALLLLPAVIWFDMRFAVKQAVLSALEIDVLLGYVAMCGWVLPLSITSSYCLFSLPRNTTTALHIPLQKRASETIELHPPRHQPGVLAPFVYGEDTPWGWLEYRTGNFQGQRLELKRAVITIGREEESDIWLDDDMASRHHAELAWDEGRVCLTDCDSLNGVLLNNRRVRGTVLVNTNDLLEIGAHRFKFLLTERKEVGTDQYDPLVNHTWRSSVDLQLDSPDLPDSDVIPAALPGNDGPACAANEPETGQALLAAPQWGETGTTELNRASPPAQPTRLDGMLIISSGEMAGKSFPLDRPVITLGRDPDCEMSINDASISRRHVQFLRQADGDYVQDLGSRGGSRVNDEPLRSPRLLKTGDIVHVGDIIVKYSSVQTVPSTPLPSTMSQPNVPRPLSGPMPLRLPSKRKEGQS